MLNIKTILCPTDFSDPAREALNVASDLAQQFGAELRLLHVIPVLPPLPPDPNFVFEVPEYERFLHADAEKEAPDSKGRIICSVDTGDHICAAWRCCRAGYSRSGDTEVGHDCDCDPRHHWLAAPAIRVSRGESGPLSFLPCANYPRATLNLAPTDMASLCWAKRRGRGFRGRCSDVREKRGGYKIKRAVTLVMLQPPTPAREPTAWIHAPSQPLDAITAFAVLNPNCSSQNQSVFSGLVAQRVASSG